MKKEGTVYSIHFNISRVTVLGTVNILKLLEAMVLVAFYNNNNCKNIDFIIKITIYLPKFVVWYSHLGSREKIKFTFVL